MRFDTSPDALMFACVRCVLALCSVLGVGVTVQYSTVRARHTVAENILSERYYLMLTDEYVVPCPEHDTTL